LQQTRLNLGYSLFIDLLTCNVPIMQEALPRWTATASRWRKNDFDHGYWLTSESRSPISETSSMACWPQTPGDSMATGMKSTPAEMSWYFWSFFSSAPVAAEPAFLPLACLLHGLHIWLRVSVGAGGVPSHTTAPLPRNLICSIWSFVIVPTERVWLSSLELHMRRRLWMHDTISRWLDCGVNAVLSRSWASLSRSDKIIYDGHWLRSQFRIHILLLLLLLLLSSSSSSWKMWEIRPLKMHCQDVRQAI